eukprot:1156641-Pelagomonas_calceolata.AAC.5
MVETDEEHGVASIKQQGKVCACLVCCLHDWHGAINKKHEAKIPSKAASLVRVATRSGLPVPCQFPFRAVSSLF